MWNLTPFPGYRSCDDCWSPGRRECVCMSVFLCVSDYLPAATTGLILTNCSLNVSADTPPPAYMPPDEQLGQESQSMETSSSLVPPNMARGGEELHTVTRRHTNQASPVWRSKMLRGSLQSASTHLFMQLINRWWFIYNICQAWSNICFIFTYIKTAKVKIYKLQIVYSVYTV